MKTLMAIGAAVLAFAGFAADALVNGDKFSLEDVPAELSAWQTSGEAISFSFAENATTGYQWDAEYSTNECEVVIEHCGAAKPKDGEPMLCGAPGKAVFTVTKNQNAPETSSVVFRYRRSWEKGVEPAKTVRLAIHTLGGKAKRSDLPVYAYYIAPLILFPIWAIFWIWPPKKINQFYGYRTPRSMKSQEAWDFAQRYSDKWMAVALIVLLAMSAGAHWLRGILNMNYECQIAYDIGVISFMPIVPIMLVIVMTELALKKRFGK